jgi:hypothetical protein
MSSNCILKAISIHTFQLNSTKKNKQCLRVLRLHILLGFFLGGGAAPGLNLEFRTW